MCAGSDASSFGRHGSAVAATDEPGTVSTVRLGSSSLIEADQQLSIFEWTLSQVLKRNLRSQFVPAAEMRAHYSNLQKLSVPVSTLLSMLARAGQQNEVEVSSAFAAAVAVLPEANAKLLAAQQCSLANLESALATLRRASEHVREKLLEACAACVGRGRSCESARN